MTDMTTPPPGLGADVLAVVDALNALRDPSGGFTLSKTNPDQIQQLRVIIKLADAAPELVAEIRRLKEAARADGDRIDSQANDLKRAQDLLVERARQADELLGQVNAERERAQGFLTRLSHAVGAGMAHLRHSTQLRAALEKIRTARTEGGCSTGEAMSKTEAWARDALALTPVEAMEVEKARDEVVKAAKDFVEAKGDHCRPLIDGFAANLQTAVEALARLEGTVR